MADLRRLMKERAAAKRIEHPYARYGNAGQLSCSLCGVPLKSDVLWPAHLTSKMHRTNVRVQKEQEEQSARKRAAEEDQIRDGEEQTPVKRARFEDESNGMDAQDDEEEAENASRAPAGLPAGFFDDTSHAAAASSSAQEDINEQSNEPVDEEWAAFEATLAESEPQPEASTSGPSLYAQATITGEEVLFDNEGKDDDEAQAEEEEEDDAPKETEEERREREEREELLERIETEEREQQEADERVDALKKRLLAIRAAKKEGGSASLTKGQAQAEDITNGPGAELGFGGRRRRRQRQAAQ